MQDFDDRWRALKADGQPGWAGEYHARNLARGADGLALLDRSGVLPRPPARVLELGCGNGAPSSRLALMGYELVGVDISATAVAWAREAFGDAGLSGVFISGDVRRMPFLGDASFDLVADGACLHCLLGSDRASCLAEVMRVLRPAGTLIVSSMCGPPRSPEALLRYNQDHEVLMENGEACRTMRSLPTLCLELTRAGFVVESHIVNANPWWDHAIVACRRP